MSSNTHAIRCSFTLDRWDGPEKQHHITTEMTVSVPAGFFRMACYDVEMMLPGGAWISVRPDASLADEGIVDEAELRGITLHYERLGIRGGTLKLDLLPANCPPYGATLIDGVSVDPAAIQSVRIPALPSAVGDPISLIIRDRSKELKHA